MLAPSPIRNILPIDSQTCFAFYGAPCHLSLALIALAAHLLATALRGSYLPKAQRHTLLPSVPSASAALPQQLAAGPRACRPSCGCWPLPLWSLVFAAQQRSVLAVRWATADGMTQDGMPLCGRSGFDFGFGLRAFHFVQHPRPAAGSLSRRA
jgi:hypothetical protein